MQSLVNNHVNEHIGGPAGLLGLTYNLSWHGNKDDWNGQADGGMHRLTDANDTNIPSTDVAWK